MPGHLPGIAVLQPVVAPLDLLSLLDALFEDAELVANAVADRRQLEGGQRIHETGGQATQAPVPQPRIALALEHIDQIELLFRHHLLGGRVETQVDQAKAQAAAGQKLRREVVGALDVVLEVGSLGGDPALNQPITDRVGHRPVKIHRSGLAYLLGAGVKQMFEHTPLEGGGVQGGRGSPAGDRARAGERARRCLFRRD